MYLLTYLSPSQANQLHCELTNVSSLSLYTNFNSLAIPTKTEIFIEKITKIRKQSDFKPPLSSAFLYWLCQYESQFW